jgi:cobalt-zinc-cadmium efflux system protein
MFAPPTVAGGTVVTIASFGLAINIVVLVLLSRAGGGLNVRGALIHVFGDLLGSIAAIVAGAVIIATGWTPIDPILSIAVAMLILRSTLDLLVQSTRVLMEGVPAGVRYEVVGRALAALPGVTGVHDLHIWQMGSRRIALSAHLTIAEGGAWPQILDAAREMLADDFGIDHVTIQPDWAPLPPGRRVIPVVPLDAAGASTAAAPPLTASGSS